MQDRTLEQLNREWTTAGRSPSAHLATATLLARHARLLRGCADLCDVVEALGPGGAERFVAMSSLLELSSELPVLRRALLQLLLPGLPGVARRIGWGAPSFSRGECMAELVSISWELTGRWAGQRRAYCVPDLLSATRLAAMRRVLALRPAGDHLQVDLPHHDLEVERTAWRVDFEALSESLPRSAAAALFAQAVLGMGATETASRLGVSTRTVQRWNRAVATGLSPAPAVA